MNVFFLQSNIKYMSTPTYTSFDDVKTYMQNVIHGNGIGAITGQLLQDVLSEILNTAEFVVNVSGSSAGGQALAAEGWAVGKQHGEPVSDGSPYYHNNSLYFASVVNSVVADMQQTLEIMQQATADANREAAYAHEQGEYARQVTDAAKGGYDTLSDRLNAMSESIDSLKVRIIPVGGLDASIRVEDGCYYRFEGVNRLDVVLESVLDGKSVRSVVLFMHMGEAPQVTFRAEEGNVYFQDGFSLDPNEAYEVNALWNGAFWVVAAMKINL